MPSYLLPFSLLSRAMDAQPRGDGLHVNIRMDDMLQMIRFLLQGVAVDESWYRATYPGVASAIDRGLFRSAQHHFVEHGYFEGKLPFKIEVDEEWYLARYAGLRAAVERRTLSSAAQHFLEHGYREGRIPNPDVETLIPGG